jgi:hypothetical protein
MRIRGRGIAELPLKGGDDWCTLALQLVAGEGRKDPNIETIQQWHKVGLASRNMQVAHSNEEGYAGINNY